MQCHMLWKQLEKEEEEEDWMGGTECMPVCEREGRVGEKPKEGLA